ncbi:hypothetical protein F5B20DRAFT_548367 [Whalleya microplaca]|nr:hypothetical protein F5B20DRAFT_548367 [Whalleya microplaca]
MAPTQEPTGGADHATMVVSGVVIVLVIISVALRFYTRIFTRAGLKADDWLILAALIATLTFSGLLLGGNQADPSGLSVSQEADSGYGYAAQDRFYLKLTFASSIIYFTVPGATKLGILLMYYRIFSVNAAFRYQLYVASGLVIGWWIACTVTTLTSCIPLERSFMSSLADPKYCINYNLFWMASGVCEILLDVVILALPVNAIVKMSLSLRQKVTVSGIFLLGGFIIITGILKVVFAYTPGSRVPSYSNTQVWTTLHMGMAIVCASLPIFKALVSRIGSSAFVIKVTSFLSIRRSGESIHSHEMPVISAKYNESMKKNGNENGRNTVFKQSSNMSLREAELGEYSLQNAAAVHLC